jgi:hypothetical protein
MKTAVEWLYDRFLFAGYAIPTQWKEKAKTIEKEQIIQAHIDGFDHIVVDFKKQEYAEQYYNQTFNQKEN